MASTTMTAREAASVAAMAMRMTDPPSHTAAVDPAAPTPKITVAATPDAMGTPPDLPSGSTPATPPAAPTAAPAADPAAEPDPAVTLEGLHARLVAVEKTLAEVRSKLTTDIPLESAPDAVTAPDA